MTGERNWTHWMGEVMVNKDRAKIWRGKGEEGASKQRMGSRGQTSSSTPPTPQHAHNLPKWALHEHTNFHPRNLEGKVLVNHIFCFSSANQISPTKTKIKTNSVLKNQWPRNSGYLVHSRFVFLTDLLVQRSHLCKSHRKKIWHDIVGSSSHSVRSWR